MRDVCAKYVLQIEVRTEKRCHRVGCECTLATYHTRLRPLPEPKSTSFLPKTSNRLFFSLLPQPPSSLPLLHLCIFNAYKPLRRLLRRLCCRIRVSPGKERRKKGDLPRIRSLMT